MSEICSGEQTFAQLRTGLRQQNISSQFNTGIGRKRKKAVKDDLIKNSKGGGDPQAVGRIGRSIMSQSILCNYFKVCTKFTFEGAE